MADRCETCKFWLTNDNKEVGECRRYPPARDEDLGSDVEIMNNTGFFGWFVRTDSDDWCGEYQIDLKKVSER